MYVRVVFGAAAQASPSGRVVNIASTEGLGATIFNSAYVAAKHASVGLSKAMAVELAYQGVTVNCVCPGPFLTDMPKQALSAESKAGVAERVPLRRWGEPRELSGPILMLVSEAGSYVNGAVLRVDGGLLSRAY